MEFEGDVKLFENLEGGEIKLIEGLILMTGGFETAVYLSLFGSNKEDNPDIVENPKTWWGNLFDDNLEFNDKYFSKTQWLLNNISATPANLLKIEDAVKFDLRWMLLENIVSTINVNVSIPNLNKIKFEIEIFAEGKKEIFTFTENWSKQKEELIVW